MIYNKDAAFSYPVLANTNNSYEDSRFNFRVTDIVDQPDSYELLFDYEVEPLFIRRLLENGQALLIFIIQSKDNLFFELAENQTSLTIPKSRLAFDDKVRAQIHIQSTEEIPLAGCRELNPFYRSVKDCLSIPKSSLVGYSNVSTMRYTGKEGVALFEKTVDPRMELDFEVVLSNDSIILKFKEEKHLLQGTARNRDLMNIYLYNGLEKALNQLISEYLPEDEDSLFLEDVDDSSLNNLHYKLYQLLEGKGVDEISYDQTDKLVQKMAPHIITKFTRSIERLNDNGN